MRLFGTFKSIEVYLILTAIFLVYTFDQLCQKEVADMTQYWYPESPPDVNSSSIDYLVRHRTRRPFANDSIGSDMLTNGIQSVRSLLPTASTPARTTATQSLPPASTETPSALKLQATSNLPPRTTTTTQIRSSTKGPTVEGVVLPTDVQDPVIVVDPSPTPIAISREAEKGLKEIVRIDVKSNETLSTLKPQAFTATEKLIADPPPPPIAISREAEMGFQEIVHSDINPTETPSTLKPQAFTAPKKPNAGFWDNILGIFGGTKDNKRIKRDADTIYNIKPKITPNQTYFGTYRCEKVSFVLMAVLKLKVLGFSTVH
jgi:hypothetical protein